MNGENRKNIFETFCENPTGNYMFKVNNRNTRIRYVQS